MEAELDALETPVLKEVTLEVYKGLIERMLATLPEKERDDFARVHSVQFLNESVWADRAAVLAVATFTGLMITDSYKSKLPDL